MRPARGCMMCYLRLPSTPASGARGHLHDLVVAARAAGVHRDALGGRAAHRPFAVGLQTRGSEPTGKIAIFSVWGAIDAEGPEYAAPFGGEGVGMTVRASYNW